jgi:hypothetical protein
MPIRASGPDPLAQPTLLFAELLRVATVMPVKTSA